VRSRLCQRHARAHRGEIPVEGAGVDLGPVPGRVEKRDAAVGVIFDDHSAELRGAWSSSCRYWATMFDVIEQRAGALEFATPLCIHRPGTPEADPSRKVSDRTVYCSRSCQGSGRQRI